VADALLDERASADQVGYKPQEFSQFSVVSNSARAYPSIDEIGQRHQTSSSNWTARSRKDLPRLQEFCKSSR
jgi:hypothetical protein